MKANEQFSLEGAVNMRDIGGYLNVEDCVVQKHHFIRGANCSKLTENDCVFLYEYGIRAIVDLRSEWESAEAPDHWLYKEPIDTYRVSLSGKLAPGAIMKENATLANMYTEIIESEKGQILKVMQILASQKGGVLFHCSAGKDRTGLITMMLLKLAGVDNDTICEDYSASEVYLKPLVVEMKKFFADRNIPFIESLFHSKKEDMESACLFFDQRYNIENYLRMIGLSDEELVQLKAKLV